MLCQNCKKNEATTHIKRVVNGEATESHLCHSCAQNSGFDDIIKSGKVGCADCYEKFYNKLLPSIQRIHGKAKHAGKVPVIHETVTAKKEEPKEKTAEDKIAELNLQMQKAIEEQNFEQAAVLRDEIKSLKGEN